MAKKAVIDVKILGDNRGLSQALGDSESKIGNFAANTAKIVAGAAVAAGAVVVKGAFAAIDFDAEMREVFTLLPGITDDAMSSMSGSVKKFSTDFGVLPDKVVPSLYQALSAGVPQDNVFEFLEVAQKAAKGGVAELETAVDGISSVVNAYGSDILNATEASDLMFTAVRLGKTDLDQLSSSLFNVTPTAAALGVGFGDVTAALATLTAQGVPTSVATTQMRQLFVELSKDGGKAATTFEDLAGKSFKDFVAAGGSTAEALDVMLSGAQDLGVGVNDLFGSVEAGSAALALAGSDVFVANTAAMADAAGATDAAFDMMNGGLRPLIDRLKAFGQVALIEIGERVVPHVERFIEMIRRNWPQIRTTVQATLQSFRTAWAKHGAPVFEAIVDAGGEVVDFFVRSWPTVREAIASVFDWISANRDVVIGALTGIGVTAAAIFVSWAASAAAAAAATIVAMAPIIAIGVALAAIGAAAVWAYQNVGWFRDAVDAVASFFRDTVWPIMQETWQVIRDVVGNIVGWVRENWDVIEAITTGVFNAVLDVITTVWDTIYGVVEGAIESIRGVIKIVTSALRGDWSGVWEGIKQYLSGVWSAMESIVNGTLGTLVRWFKGLPGRLLGALGDILGLMTGKGLEIVGGLKDGAVSAWLGLSSWVRDIPNKIVNAIGDLARVLFDAGKKVIGGLLDGMKDAWKGAASWVGGLGSKIVNLKGPPAYDKVMLVENGGLIIGGLLRGMQQRWGSVESFLESASDQIAMPRQMAVGAITGAALSPTAAPSPSAAVGGGDMVGNVYITAPAGVDVATLQRQHRARTGSRV